MQILMILAKRFIFLVFISYLLMLNACSKNPSGNLDEAREARKEWFKEYFLRAANDKDNSLRIFCLWFGGDRQAYTSKIFIGGNEIESTKWFAGVEDLLLGFKEAKLAHLKFIFEIVVDDATKNSEVKKLTSLQERFPHHFKVTPLSSIAPKNLPPKEILEHAFLGNPAFAADAIRIWYLRQPDYFTNVYIDVDTFIDKTTHYERYKNYKIFGREVEPGYVYFANINNEYLVDKSFSDDKIEILKKNGLEEYEKNKVLISHYKNRARFLNFSSTNDSFNAYKKDLDYLVEYQIKNSDNVIDMVSAIIYTFGPGLWLTLSSGAHPDIKENPGINDQAVSAQAWKGGNQIPVGYQSLRVRNFNKLLFLDKIKDHPDVEQRLTKIVLNLNYLGWDYDYFSRFPEKELSQLLAKEISQFWQEALAILELKIDKSDIEAIKEEFKKAAGGLYIALGLLPPTRQGDRF